MATLKEKIITGLGLLGIATTAFSVVALEKACIFDAEVLPLEEGKICFDTKKDYKTFKDDRIAKYKIEPAYLWGENGDELLAMLMHELLKKQDGTLQNITDETELMEELIKIAEE